MEYLSDWRKEKTRISLKGKTYTFSNTLIGVFHDLTLASSADRILFLKEGKIISFRHHIIHKVFDAFGQRDIQPDTDPDVHNLLYRH